MSAQPSWIRDIGKGSVVIVVKQRRSVVGKVCAEKIEIAVAVVVSNRRAHPSLFPAIRVIGYAREDTDIRESSIVIVMVKNARCAVASHVDVRPAVVVIIERRNAEAIVARRAVDAGRRSYVLEAAFAQVVVKDVLARWQATRPAKDGDALPQAGGVFAGGRGMCKVEVGIVRDGQIELPIPIVIHEGAAGAPGLSVACHAGFFRHLFEFASKVVVESIFPVIGNVKIFPSIIVKVPYAYALTPSGCHKACLGSYVSKRPVVVVVIQVIGRGALSGKTFQR